MGYETTFKLKPGVELDSEFKAYSDEYKESNQKMMMEVLETMCTNMKCENKSMELIAAWRDISYMVRYCILDISQAWKIQLKKDLESEDGKLFCGWGYSRGRNTFAWENLDSVIDFYTREFFELAVVDPDCGPFDSENDKYYNKSQKIHDIAVDIEDSVWEAMNNMFIARYRDSDDAIERGDDNTWGETEEDDDEEPIEPFESDVILHSSSKEKKSKKSDDEDEDDE